MQTRTTGAVHPALLFCGNLWYIEVDFKMNIEKVKENI